MKPLQYTFTITIDFNAEKAIEQPAYFKAFEESADEFASELNEFLKKHPLIQASQMQKQS